MNQPKYTAKDFAKLIGISKSQLKKMESEGMFPEPTIIDGIRYYWPHDIPLYLDRLDKGPLVKIKNGRFS